MSDIQNIRLEFLRAGPAHNQLLSPLTPYLALCGADGPVSVQVPFEHDQLLNRLKRLRYEIDGIPVAGSQREAELQEIGAAIGRMLGEIPALVGDLRAARSDTSRLVNIQLAISAFELGLVPFEATMAPADTSGSGAPLLLRTLTSMTREIRRGEPLKLEWDRPPKILFAFASPTGLPAVPAQAHLEALRRAIDPWIKIKDSPQERVTEVRRVLTVLKNASARSISDACQAEDFTHVHILAHGSPVTGSDNKRFGVVLAKEGDPSGRVVVDGQSLAIALKSMKTDGQAKQPPTVVSLATCDSGNTATVLTPGGSIAHELHAQDIPWVIASQFPLWMRASNIAVEILYRGLLAGKDPRWVLHDLRQRLRIDLPDTHDWASIVAYAAIAPDLEAQVDSFRSKQTKLKMNVKFDRMDELVNPNADAADAGKARDKAAVDAELAALSSAVRVDLALWCKEPAAERDPKEAAERWAMYAASEKRIAIIYANFKDADKSNSAYRKSSELYEKALKIEPVNHWVMTQFLSVAAIPALAGDDQLAKLPSSYGRWWAVARQLAEWQLRSSSRADRVWAHGTLAELDLLGAIYGGTGFDRPQSLQSIVVHCQEIFESSAEDSFPLMSTRRQFGRYVNHWRREQWEDLARAALKALGVSDTASPGATPGQAPVA
jgi:hypothetical protein